MHLKSTRTRTVILRFLWVSMRTVAASSCVSMHMQTPMLFLTWFIHIRIFISKVLENFTPWRRPNSGKCRTSTFLVGRIVSAQLCTDLWMTSISSFDACFRESNFHFLRHLTDASSAPLLIPRMTATCVATQHNCTTSRTPRSITTESMVDPVEPQSREGVPTQRRGFESLLGAGEGRLACSMLV